jgi:hypothetical protein
MTTTADAHHDHHEMPTSGRGLVVAGVVAFPANRWLIAVLGITVVAEVVSSDDEEGKGHDEASEPARGRGDAPGD